MSKLSKSNLLLVSIVIFSFIYRLSLLLRDTFPPSADIGLHNSLIHTIIDNGGSNLLWNNYHMGSGVSLTFPGYHIFVSYIILLTGLPDYLAQALVAALFSTLIVVVAFLITRKVWTVPAAFIVTFLVAFARPDLEMLMWGGYPNIIALMLIPLTFYMFLQRAKFSLPSFLAATSLLSATIFLTHSLSAVIFAVITFFTVIFVTVFAKQFTVRRTHVLLWLAPLVIGAIIVSPFLIQVAPLYLGANSGTFTGGVADVRLALEATQYTNLEFVYPLIIGAVLIFIFARKYHGKFLAVPALLLALWILIPAMGTQGYLFGVYTDYNRFKYFVYLPFIALFGIIIDHSSGFLAKIIDKGVTKAEQLPHLRPKLRRILMFFRPLLSRKFLYAIFVLGFTMYAFISVFTFAPPVEGIKMSNYYQMVDQPMYDAIQWAKTSTPQNAVFAADDVYGWWIAGFAQRQTLSGTPPQALIVSREFEPAENVQDLLDTSYVLDNGLIQVREDGCYIARHNPIFLAKLNDTYFPYSFFNFNSNDIKLQCRVNETLETFTLSNLEPTDMHLENTTDYAAVAVSRGNQYFNITQTTTVYQGVSFANMSLTLTALPEVHLDWFDMVLHTKYAQRYQTQNTLGLFETPVHVGGQLIFTKNQPQISVYTPENPSSLGFTYNLEGESNQTIEIFTGVFQVPVEYTDEQSQAAYNWNLVQSNLQHYADKVSDAPLDIFNYRSFLTAWNVSYVVCRDSELQTRLVNDPAFGLVYANREVTIFKVK